MKKIGLKKITLIILLLALFLYIGTFFHMHDIKANTYEGHNPWYGHELDFQEINVDAIEFESIYAPFESISNDSSLVEEDKIYVIESANDLYLFSVLSNGEDYDIYRRLHYVLGKDIDYYDILVVDSSKHFEPVGFRYPFLGTFDGQGFEITNLYIEPIFDSFVYENKYMGLTYLSMFSHIGATGVVKNLGLINPLIIQPIEWGAMAYVSSLAGLNEGHIHHTYYIDTRGHQAGFNAEGAFHLAGLVSKNTGVVEQSFVASPHIKSLAVLENVSTSAIYTENLGLMNHVYYDQDLLYDLDTDYSGQTGLSTIEFQNAMFFDDSWVFNDHYTSLTDDILLKPQYSLKNTYPMLQGLKVGTNKLLISNAVDLLIMNELLLIANPFRSQTYELISDIDMSMIANDAYQQAAIGFNGRLTSALVSEDNILYQRNELQGGNQAYHTIIGLNLTQASYVSEYALYGLFSVLFGNVEHLNFIYTKIETSDINQTYEREALNIGVIAGQSVLGTIIDVHVHLEMTITTATTSIGKVSLGGIVGSGSGFLQRVSTSGDILINDQYYQEKLDGSAFSGIIGHSEDISLEEVLSAVDMYKSSYEVINEGVSYLGGIIGFGTVDTLDKVVSKSQINLLDHTFHNQHYIGGIFGYITHIKSEIKNIYHQGVIHINVDQDLSLKINGIGYIVHDDLNTMISSITNHGLINLNKYESLTPSELILMDIDISLGLSIEGSLSVYGLYQTKGQLLDLSLIKNFSGLITHVGDEPLNLTKAYQKANLIFQSSDVLTQEHIKIFGIALGSAISYEHLRQEGHITVNVMHPSYDLVEGHLYVSGIFESISNSHTGSGFYQGGNINITKDESLDVSYHVYVSGVGYQHENTTYDLSKGVSHDSIEITDQKGSFDTALSNANILVTGHFDGMVFASGIVLYNYGTLSNAINLGDVTIINDVLSQNNRIEASGIAHQLLGKYARVKDAANNGDIKAVSNTNMGFAHASGIVLRNDKLYDDQDVTSSDEHQFAKILFSINYGDVYAYNHSNESSYTITDETKSKAAGLLAIGLLSVVNNTNYGNIYSNHLASGMIGFIYMNKFGTLGQHQVYMSNGMNYGLVREITAYDPVDQTFTIDMNQAPSSASYQAFGAIVGKIHTNTSTWAFAGDVMYPIDRVYFGYLINFDDKINMFASAPSLSSNWQDVFGGDTQAANEVILNMLKYMATTNPDDDSTAPFTYFYTGGWIGQYLGKQIDYYSISDQDGGMFYEDFAFRSQRPTYSGTDQYIRDYISYIPRDKVNDQIITRLEMQTENTYPGIYALSSSSGINNGIFIPDNFRIELLKEYSRDYPLGDQSYLGDPDDPFSISHQLYKNMRQIKMNFASTIYDLEIIESDAFGQAKAEGVTLKDPVIDEARSLITYYLPSNALILGEQTPTIMNVKSYVEVSDGVANARKVLDIFHSGDPTYTWVGTHVKDGNQMVEVGPYKTTGYYHLTSDLVTTTSYSRNTPVYTYTGNIYDTIGAVDGLFKHKEHTWVFLFWHAEGYIVEANEAEQGAGYGAYELYTKTNYPPLYQYVGPREGITYVESELIDGVSVYEPSDVYFVANLEEHTYLISQNASLKHNDVSMYEPISIPRSYGIYDLMTYQDEYIDSVEDHYGMIRVFSNAYNEHDPATYKDYEIRVIRTADESITDMLSLTVNGQNALSPTDLNHQVTSLINLDGTNNQILVASYETYNISDLYDMLKHVDIYHFETEVKVHTSLYRLDYGHVSTINTFDNLTGSWGYGSFDILFEPLDDFPSGSYTMRTTLLSGSVFEIHFTKEESSEKQVLLLEYQDQVITPDGNMHVSYVPFGIYYDEAVSQTQIVNFNGLSELSNIYYSDLAYDVPAYLDNLVISYFSTLLSVDLIISQLSDFRYQYDVVYLIEAEDKSTSTFTHRLIEHEVNLEPIQIYKNGGKIDVTSDIDIFYNESPTVRVVYDLEHVYMPTHEIFSITDQYMPLETGEEALLDVDYFKNFILNVGFELDFNQDVNKGTFVFNLNYNHEVTLWNYTFNWQRAFDNITLHKLRNDASKLTDVLFVSDTIFSGFNTIVDIEYITTTMYEEYINDPSTRRINVLPTTGIAYHMYDNYDAYYVIGQVQKTNLVAYEPIFYVSDHAMIRKVINDQEIHYDFQSEDLSSDFSPMGDQFNFVHYRVYAEDFDQNPTHYTDYYIALQDVTNNIRFEITIDNQSLRDFRSIYVSIDICQNEETCHFEDIIYKMSVYATYDYIEDIYKQTHFQTTMHGTYKVDVDLPIGYEYQIILEQSAIDGTSFYLEDSILPRKYYLTIVIVDNDEVIPWGNGHKINQNE